MAIIIDSSCWIRVIQNENEYKELRQWLILKPRIKLGVCDELENELLRPKKYIPVYEEFKRRGQIRKLNPEEETQLQLKIEEICIKCKSDDHFILAMMIIAYFRLIVTKDGNLKKDVKNREILNPPGKIYNENSRRSAQRMLREFGFLGD